jgi:hypothetical protein
MWDKFGRIFVVLLTALWLTPPFSQIRAQQKIQLKNEESSRPRRVLRTEIITQRLSAKDIQRWRKIKSIIFCSKHAGPACHPTLVKLWNQLETSGHAVYIELISDKHFISSNGGSFKIERFDPLGLRHEAVIRLYLNNINQAYVGPISARSDGFIPFVGLSREERYVEVLGHELAHAVWILNDLQRTKIVTEMIQQTNEMFFAQRSWMRTQLQPKPLQIDKEMEERLIQRDLLLEHLENQAESVEALVWLELVSNRHKRGRNM